MYSESGAFVLVLRAEIATHRAVNHPFLDHLSSPPLNRADWLVVAEHQYPLVCLYSSYLEDLLHRTASSEAKLWIARALVEDRGEARSGRDRATRWARFLDAAGGQALQRLGARLPTGSQRFIEEHQRIVRARPPLEGIGAVGPGNLWVLAGVIRRILPVLQEGFESSELEYFTSFLAQEAERDRWLEDLFSSYDEESLQLVYRGTRFGLEAWARFWDDVQDAVLNEVENDGRPVVIPAPADRKAAQSPVRPTLGALLKRTRRLAAGRYPSS